MRLESAVYISTAMVTAVSCSFAMIGNVKAHDY